jgi:hypothetical protein
MVRHCPSSQRVTASAFSLSAPYASSAFDLLEGKPVEGGLHQATRHFCCPTA